jgi:hypothetical protein
MAFLYTGSCLIHAGPTPCRQRSIARLRLGWTLVPQALCFFLYAVELRKPLVGPFRLIILERPKLSHTIVPTLLAYIR